MKKFYAWYQKHITGAIFIGLLLGILTGLFLADRFAPVLTVTSLLGGIYMNALNMMIFPLVFCSVVMGICSIGSIKTTGKITGASMVFFLCTTALASLAGLIIPRLIHLGKGVSFEMATSDIVATDMSNILDTIKNLIPSNPVSAFAQGNMLQVLVFAVIIGFTLIAVGEKGDPLLKVIDSLNEVCLKIISTIMYFTPIGVFCTIVPVVQANGTETIISLATQLIILYLAFFIFAIAAAVVYHKWFKKWREASATNLRRHIIVTFAFCLILSFCAEVFFGVADITGAFFAGVIISMTQKDQFIASKFDVVAYMLLSPIFFASIGLKVDGKAVASMGILIVVYAIVLTIIAIITKIMGCGLGAKVCGYKNYQCLRIGVGMVSRGEVALIVANKGIEAGLMSSELVAPVIIVVIATTIITPIVLKPVFLKTGQDVVTESKLVENIENRDKYNRPIEG